MWFKGKLISMPDIFQLKAPRCSFCGKEKSEVQRLIEGPDEVYICDECVLLGAGAKGRRYALPHATIHMHPAAGGTQGYTEDVRIAFREQERVQTQLFQLIGKHTGHTWREIEEQFERDRFMNALDAKAYGLVDNVVGDTGDIVVIGKNGEVQLGTPALIEEKSTNGAVVPA